VAICGYGLRDKGINTKLLEWIYADTNRRFVLIHPSIKELREDSRAAFYLRWDDLVERKQLLFIELPIQSASWSMFKEGILSR
jgi:hypothetical protein